MRNMRLLLCLSALLMSGCTQTYLVGFEPQSHFDYPNSNIYPMGHVKGQVSKSAFLSMPDMSSALKYEAISNALQKQPGSDMLLNSFHTMDLTNHFIINTITYRVEGTAARMKAGEQELR